MRFSLQLIDAPTAEPVTLDEARLHLRQDGAADDALITSLIVAARQQVERDTQRQLMTAQWRAVFDAFPDLDTASLEIPLPPLQSVVAVQYLDAAGALQTWSSLDYVVDTPSGPWAREARVTPGVGKAYPEAAALPGAVRVQLLAGSSSAANVPAPLKQAMKLLIGHWYANREAVITGTISGPVEIAYDALLAPFQRTTAVMA